ncbi:hypothetical protein [Hoeflea sp.]|uniref:hypothetical protein n=1 Tax=Hoeflea sp. TaxID=1940281 RepID=UPI00198E918E|nr:hypothetical protein [Hoeflea sp.]MBC7286042.1 hypothetical protein [Hoeflea sp.]
MGEFPADHERLAPAASAPVFEAERLGPGTEIIDGWRVTKGKSKALSLNVWAVAASGF